MLGGIPRTYDFRVTRLSISEVPRMNLKQAALTAVIAGAVCVAYDFYKAKRGQ